MMSQERAKAFAKNYISAMAIRGLKPNKNSFILDYQGDKAEAELIWYYIDLEL